VQVKHEKQIKELAKCYLVDNGKHFKLKKHDTADTHGLGADFKTHSQDLLTRSTQMLSELQGKLYAQDRWSMLLIFQAMDAAGKDGTIKHVMSGINPQGCQVYSFKAPSAKELDHDFMWRTNECLPQRGNIGIFNRSYYEEVLVVRVHPEILEAERLPDELVTKEIWNNRFEDINALERYLSRNGTVIRKFFLHISKDEQKRRFLRRLEEPDRNWKFSSDDVRERQHWDAYQDAYEEMIANTATEHAPWIVVPADNKWFARLVVSSVVVDALQDLKLEYPVVDAEKRKDLAVAEVELKAEGRKRAATKKTTK
jgi:PPK2 family polyphosphate:nucleotide phosphotransferase